MYDVGNEDMLWLDKCCGESNMFKRVKVNGILFNMTLLRQFKMVTCKVSHISFAFLQFETLKNSSMPNAEVIIFLAFKLY